MKNHLFSKYIKLKNIILNYNSKIILYKRNAIIFTYITYIYIFSFYILEVTLHSSGYNYIWNQKINEKYIFIYIQFKKKNYNYVFVL